MAKLANEQHEQFCHEFLVDFNATQAAIRAKYSKRTARSQGSELLTRPDISERVKELHGEVLQGRAGVILATVDSLVAELSRIAHCDVRDAYNADGSLKPIHEIPDNTRKCIAGIEVDELFEGYGPNRAQIGVTKKLKFWDKNKGIELLGRHFKMFTDKLEHSMSLEQILAASKE